MRSARWWRSSASPSRPPATSSSRSFRADPAHRGKVMDRGVWRYTRHPELLRRVLRVVGLLRHGLAGRRLVERDLAAGHDRRCCSRSRASRCSKRTSASAVPSIATTSGAPTPSFPGPPKKGGYETTLAAARQPAPFRSMTCATTTRPSATSAIAIATSAARGPASAAAARRGAARRPGRRRSRRRTAPPPSHAPRARARSPRSASSCAACRSETPAKNIAMASSHQSGEIASGRIAGRGARRADQAHPAHAEEAQQRAHAGGVEQATDAEGAEHEPGLDRDDARAGCGGGQQQLAHEGEQAEEERRPRPAPRRRARALSGWRRRGRRAP